MKKTLEDRQWHCVLYPVKFQDREEKREDAKGLIHISKTPCSSVIIIYELKISFIWITIAEPPLILMRIHAHIGLNLDLL